MRDGTKNKSTLTPVVCCSVSIAILALADPSEGPANRHALYKLNSFVVTGSRFWYDDVSERFVAGWKEAA